MKQIIEKSFVEMTEILKSTNMSETPKLDIDDVFWRNVKNFKRHEFEDNKGECWQNKDCILMVDRAREMAKIVFTILSACRNRGQNKEAGGVDDSSHLLGFAVDISCTSSRDRFKILTSLYLVGFRRFGIYETFIHVDNDPTKPPEVIWFSKLTIKK